MAKFDYIKAQNTAIGLVDKFGFDMLISRTASTYDPVTGTETVILLTEQTATVVNLPASSGTVQAFDNRYKEDFKRGKIRFFYVAAKGLAFTPEPGDTFILDDKVFDVAGTTPLNPAGTPVLYTMAGRVSGRTIEVVPGSTITFGGDNLTFGGNTLTYLT